jgi:hypothetical protein
VGAFVVLFIGTVQKLSKLPHDVIEPSALRAAKAAISKFIQMQLPLPLLKPTVQSRCGVVQILEVQTHPLTKVISRFIQLTVSLKGGKGICI